MPTAHSPEGFREQKLTMVPIQNFPKIGVQSRSHFLELHFLIVHTLHVSSWTLCLLGTGAWLGARKAAALTAALTASQ